jgi:multidrug efflux pump
MLSGFFIERPIFASVLSILITVAGGVAVLSLPVAQYPEITPPTVQVSCNYPGANAQVVADTVAAPIEQQVNGVENMLYMSSQSNNDGSYVLTATFDLGTDLNSALVLVQNRVSLAMPQLPDVVQRQGVTVKKKSPNILLCVNFISPDGRYDDLYLSNYATIRVKDELARVEGVGDINLLGSRDYSLRVWLDPHELSSRNLTAGDVVNAVQRQNIPLCAGAIGQQPSRAGAEFQLTCSGLGRLTQPQDFGAIVLKSLPADARHPSPRLVYLRDVARIELGAQQYNQWSELDGAPTVALALYQLPGANALETGDRIKRKMEELGRRFPEGLEYRIAYDTTPFVEESVREVFRTLRDAMLLVAVVVLVFLQSWRATIIPLVAVPVAIVGTFVAMAALGFSLNNISLFGLVLAIGIVVDDAIVVVENVERWLAEGLAPRDAARQAMQEVTGPVVAVALVLCAVFVPCAFISGITGQFFRQFAITIAVSTVISAFNSLTLSPALAAILLRPHGAGRDPLTRLLDAALGGFFRLFNRGFQRGTTIYTRLVGGLLRVSVIVLLLYGGLLYLTSWSFQRMPQGFIPLQDQGWLLVNVQLPDSASLQRTHEVMKRIDALVRTTPGVAHTISISGQSILLNANGSNFGSMFVILDPFGKRTTRELNGFRIFFKLRRKLSASIRDAVVGVFPAPPVNGLGTAGGFKLLVEDRAARGPDDLQRQTDGLIRRASAAPGLMGMFTLFRAAIPQLYVDVDRVKAKSLDVSLTDLFQCLQINLGSLYVNNFNQFGRSWQVNVQADDRFRNRADGIRQLKVRNAAGYMVPLGAVAEVRESCGPGMVTRYNMYAAAPINGNLAPGMSSGEAIGVLDGLAAQALPRSMKTEWTELTFMQIRAGNTAMIVFGLAVVFVFLVLAALYESWSLPLAVILVVPMCLLCSVAGVASVPHMDINIFTQIGFVVLVGLASKNAILIVEFAKQLAEQGRPLRDATTEACRLRLRPIVMTSLAFILGVVPLLVAGGAGAEMRRTLGIAVFGGMLGVTLFGIFLTPVFFFVIQGIGGLPAFRHPALRRFQRAVVLLVNVAMLGIPALLLAIFYEVRRRPPPAPPTTDHRPPTTDN